MKSISTTLLLSVTTTALCFAEDWPQWRGPSRDCHVKAADWPDSLDAGHLSEAWRVPLGPSYSGPIVAGSRVFVTETEDESREVVTAFDRPTGDQLWQVQWPGAMKVPFFAAANGSWIRSTPACDGKRLFVMGIREVLVALDVESGVEAWRVDFPKQFRTGLPKFGAVCSPLLHDDFVYVQAGFAVVKLRKSDGHIVWRSSPESGGAFGQGMSSSPFSSPVIASLAGKEQLVVQTRAKLMGLDLETGHELWSKAIPATRGMNILTPLVKGDAVFTSSHGGATFLFGINHSQPTQSVRQLWRTRQQAYMSSPVLIGDDIYLHLRNQRLTCIDVKTGKAHWTSTPFGKYWSIAVNGDRILSLDERGDLRLVAASPKEYSELSLRRVSDQPAWAHLAVSDNQIFIRDLSALSVWNWK